MLPPNPLGRPQTPAEQQQSAPSPVAGAPGSYQQLPIGDPQLTGRVYEQPGDGRAPQTADASRAAAEARALARAAMLCELGPMAKAPARR